MRTLGVRCLVAAAGCLLILAYSSMAGRSVTAAEGERLVKQLALKSGGRLTLKNTQGDIKIRSWDREQVEIRAERNGKTAEDLALVPIDIAATDDLIEIASEYPAYAPELKVQVDYDVRVPVHVDLKLIKTVRGQVEISDVTGRMIVRVANGAVKITGSAGALDIETTNGQIDAVLTGMDTRDWVYLDTWNGDINLRLPKDVKPNLALQAMNGSIQSDIPVTIRKGWGPEFVELSEQIDKPIVRLISVNGNIQLTR